MPRGSEFRQFVTSHGTFRQEVTSHGTLRFPSVSRPWTLDPQRQPDAYCCLRNMTHVEKHPIAVHLIAVVSDLADSDRRSVARKLHGLPVRNRTDARIRGVLDANPGLRAIFDAARSTAPTRVAA